VPPWYTELWQPPPADDPAGEEAGLLVDRFNRLQPYDLKRIYEQWVSQRVGPIVGQFASAAFAPATALLPVQWVAGLLAVGDSSALNNYMAHQDRGPPELLILAVRRARQAIAANPANAVAHLNLAKAYDSLRRNTRESIGPQELGEIRRTQVIAEATAALRLGLPPTSAADAHALIMQSVKHLDLQVHHFRDLVEAMRAAGPGTNDPEAFARQLQSYEENLAKAAKQLDYNLANFENNQAGKPLLERAKLALEVGLAEKALEVLQSSKGPEDLIDRTTRTMLGRELLIQLLFDTGQPEKLGELLEPRGEGGDRRMPGQLPFVNLRRYAAQSDSPQAKKVLEDLMGQSSPSIRAPLLRLEGELVLRGALESRVPMGGPLVLDMFVIVQSLERMWAGPVGAVNQANTLVNLRLLHAWFALEEGNIAEVKQDLEAAQQLMPGRYTPPVHQNLFQCLQDWLARGER
jgi:hypothetical protein